MKTALQFGLWLYVALCLWFGSICLSYIFLMWFQTAFLQETIDSDGMLFGLVSIIPGFIITVIVLYALHRLAKPRRVVL